MYTQGCLSIEGGPPANVCHVCISCFCCCCDLDLNPMTLLYEFDLDILKAHVHPRRKRQ